MKEFPEHFAGERVQPSEAYYSSLVNRPFTVDMSSTFWTYTHLRHSVEHRYSDIAVVVRRTLDAVEADAFLKQRSIEAQVEPPFENDPEEAHRLLMDFSKSIYDASMDALSRIAQMENQ
jgi:dipeptidase